MRVSVDKNDPGYVSDPWRYSVFFNGEKLNDCITADADKGEVIVIKRDETGEKIRHEFGFVRETLQGSVAILKTE